MVVMVLVAGCTRSLLPRCEPVDVPNSYSCATYDGGVSEWVSVQILTTDVEGGFFEREPTCVFVDEGSNARFEFDQPFCRYTPDPSAMGEDLTSVNVRCVVPSQGRWSFVDAHGGSVLVERTDAGHVCTVPSR